ncbi:hypothetical protein NXS19_011814 [Fusarium pseudograminearum]|nr:hypothetical protein NXS19_011814 [Fusarium pseudograminearum]
MKIPYNVVHVSGDVLYAARGGKIHSFSLQDGSHLSTWKHPDVDKVDAAVKAISGEASSETIANQDTPAVEGEGDDGPPAKRQKTEEPKDETITTEANVQDDAKNAEEAKPEGKKGVERRARTGATSKNQRSTISHEFPTVQSLHT